MPRKKSAQKKAREAAAKAKADSTSGPAQDTAAVAASKDHIELKEDVSDSESSSNSESEDEYGALITEEVEEGINKVLEAISTDDSRKLLDPKVRFFEEPEKAAAQLGSSKSQKPVYLKDYHRMNLLSGGSFDDEPAMETVDGKPSFVSEQKKERTEILSEIKNAVQETEEGEEDDFLVKKAPAPATRTATLADPAVDEDKFLKDFVNQRAWIPQEGDKVISLDRGIQEDDEEFEDAVEQYEAAYNFRFEDPNAAEIVSYARNQATLRREKDTSRRKKREEKKQEKLRKKEELNKAVHKKKNETVQKLSDVLNSVKKEYGTDIDEKMVKKLTDTLLKGDFDDSKWDEVVCGIFNEEYYQQSDNSQWKENENPIGSEFIEDEEMANYDLEEDTASKKTRKEKKLEKQSEKSKKKAITNLIENAVEENKTALVEKVEEERGRSQDKTELKFRYREVSPESFGLTAKEIFAADDTDLNEYIGLKKFAPYRPKELRQKDKRKVMKTKRLTEWRKKVFKSENGLI